LEGALAMEKELYTALFFKWQQSALNAPEAKELAHRVRRIVIGSIHPDKAADSVEREWRTKICQNLFPEIDRVMNGAPI
jgi:hypothetical protein